jgi:hypothetical protein
MKPKNLTKAGAELHMLEQPEGWLHAGKSIPFTEMTDEELQKFKYKAQRKELFFYNRSQVFSELVEKFDEEATRRGVTLKDRETQFHQNNRKARQLISQS